MYDFLRPDVAPFQFLGQVAVEHNLPQLVCFLLPLFLVRRLHRPTLCATFNSVSRSGSRAGSMGGNDRGIQNLPEFILYGDPNFDFATRERSTPECLLLPAFRRITAARDLTGLVEPLALYLDPGGVFLSLRRHLHRIAHLFLPVLGENDLRSGSVAVHDDQWIVDRHVKSGPLARRRSGGRRRRTSRGGRAGGRGCGSTVVGLLDAFSALVVPRAQNQLAVLGIKALFALPVRFAEVVVVTCDLIQDQLAVDQRLPSHLVLCMRSRRACQCETAQPQGACP